MSSSDQRLNPKLYSRDPLQLGPIDLDELEVSRRFWKERSGQGWAFYCPLCKAARKIPQRPRPGPKHFIQMVLTAAFLTLLTWQWLSWKGMISFLPIWSIFEVLYRARVRGHLGCPHCGFDPYLYATDVKRARVEVERYWRHKFAEQGIPYPEKGQSMKAPLQKQALEIPPDETSPS